MGTPLPVRWKLLLFPCCLLLAVTAGATPALAAEEALGAPLVAGAPQMDGVVDDPYWTDTATRTLTFNGSLAEDTTREVALRLAHNGTHLFLALTFTPGGGTHPDDFVLVTFAEHHDPAAGSGRADLMRYGWEHPTLLDDHVWDGEAWVRDAASGCAVDGAAARTESEGEWHYELAKPFSGDACDVALAAGQRLAMRIEFRENRPAPHHGDDFRWPRGSDYLDAAGNHNGELDEVSAWGTLFLSHDGSTEVPAHRDGAAEGDTAGDGGTQDGDASGAGDAPGAGDDGAGEGDASQEGPGDKEAAESASLPVVVTLVSLVLLGQRLRSGPLRR